MMIMIGYIIVLIDRCIRITKFDDGTRRWLVGWMDGWIMSE